MFSGAAANEQRSDPHANTYMVIRLRCKGSNIILYRSLSIQPDGILLITIEINLHIMFTEGVYVTRMYRLLSI